MSLLVFLYFLFIIVTGTFSSPCPLYKAAKDASVTGKYIVVLEDIVSDEEFRSVLNSIVQLSDDHKALGIVMYVEKSFTVQLNMMCLAIARSLFPQVKYIEEEQMAFGAQDTNLPWYLDRLDQLTASSRPIDYQFAPMDTGKGVDIYILDTGINYDHEEFEGRAKFGGYDAVDNYHDNALPQNGFDCQGHGTHVSSLAGGKTYGVAKEANLFSVRVLDCNNFAPWSVVLDGIDYTARIIMERKRPAIVSLSLGGNYQRSANEAVDKLHELHIPVVVAAGNGQRDACQTSPASAQTVITVGATNFSDNLYWYANSNVGSNYGSCVDIFAPGDYIIAANHSCNNCSKVLSGTSMATPLVSGIVALFLQRQPLLSPDQIKEKLVACGLKNLLKFDQIQSDETRVVTTNLLAQVCTTCGGTYPHYVTLDITSPNYPDDYTHDLSCLWTIPATQRQEIVLTVSDVHLEDGYDTLTIHSDSGVHQFTGKNIQALPLTLQSTFFTIHMKADVSGSGRGFMANFTKYYANSPLKVLEPDIFPVDREMVLKAATKVFVRVNVQEIEGLVSEWKAKGFDVWWVNSYQVLPDTTWFVDLILHNSTVNHSRGFVELTSSELNHTIQQQKEEGFSIYAIHSSYTEAKGFRYCAIFRKVNLLTEVQAYWNMELLPHLFKNKELLEDKWSLTSQSFTSVPSISVNAVYYRDLRLVYNIPFYNPDEKKQVYDILTFVEFTIKTLDIYRGYYPEYISSYYYPSSTSRISIIYKKYLSGDRFRWFRWGINETEVLIHVEQNSQLWDPMYIVPYKHNGSPAYIVGWYLKRI